MTRLFGSVATAIVVTMAALVSTSIGADDEVLFGLKLS